MGSVRTASILEAYSYDDARVDVENGIIHDVAIIRRVSANGREYPDATLKAAIPMIEGTKVYLDHPPDGDLNKTRSVRDLAGSLMNVHFVENEGLKGDLHVLPREAWLLDTAKRMPKAIGHSLNGSGRVSFGDDGKEVVEEISAVRSVDLVTDPATVSSLFESKQHKEKSEGGDIEMDYKNLTLEELAKHRPDLMEQIRKDEGDSIALTDKVETLTQSNKTLTEENDAFKATAAIAQAKTDVAKLLETAKLPKQVITDVFVEQLVGADDATRKALIEDRKKLVEKVSNSDSAESTERNDLTEDKKEVEDEEILSIFS